MASPEGLARFYADHLGMIVKESGAGLIVGYDGADAEIELVRGASGGAYVHDRGDRYWKIGITLPNVEIACRQLREAGIAVTEPWQFGDIGYMAHLADPEGFVIELLQHRFEGRRSSDEGDPRLPLGGGARIGQITLRSLDLDADLAFYRDRLGMGLLSIQPLPDHGFDLYFLACTDDRPPETDLEAVGNREWLWQRPYTTLELQHVRDRAAPFALPAAGAAGFAGLTLSDAGPAAGHLRDAAGGVVTLSP